jgi:hypothetical protein
VIHILRLVPQEEPPPSAAYVSYQSKLFRIPFRETDFVREFKKNIQQQTAVSVETQVLLYREQFLEDDKRIKLYQIKSEDILRMAKIVKGSTRKDIDRLFPNRTFQGKLGVRNRCGSAA